MTIIKSAPPLIPQTVAAFPAASTSPLAASIAQTTDAVSAIGVMANTSTPPDTTAIASARKGIIAHGEHLVDLVLDIVPGTEQGTFPASEHFEGFIRNLMTQIETKKIELLNEKIDGSPAILLGFDAHDQPFVAYKHGISSTRDSRIVRSQAEAQTLFGDSPMGQILGDCIEAIGPTLARFPNKRLVFQADLLFTPRNEAKHVTKKAITIRANPFGITYTLPARSKFYAFALPAQVGLVVHTVGERKLDPDTGAIVGVSPLENPEAIEAVVKALRSEHVFAIDPWSRRVQIDGDTAHAFTPKKRRQLETILAQIREGLTSLSPEFRERWRTFLPQFRTFLNASLKEGHHGGMYRAAASEEAFDFKRIVTAFQEWITDRSERIHISPAGTKSRLAPKKMPAELAELISTRRAELKAYLKAYYDANRVQYLLKPHMQEAYASKLGGGRIEGIILSNEQTIVKLVDRLDFTLQNFAGESERKQRNRARSAARKASPEALRTPREIPESLQAWHAGAAVYIGKFQPPHAGHIAMISAAVAQFGIENVLVLASDRVPDLSAEHWKDVGVVARNAPKKDLAEKRWTHIFTREIREQILRAGMPKGTPLLFADTAVLWSYLNRAVKNGEPGTMALVMGEKEIEAGRYQEVLERYPEHLRTVPLQMQAEGLSSTMVRKAIQSLHERGDTASYEFLTKAFHFIAGKERDRIIGQLLKQWGDVEAAVARVLA